jgi:hypothetical protein
VFENLVGFWYYQAAFLIDGSEVSSLSTRPVARYVTMRVFVFYIVVFETNSSVPFPKALLPYPPPFDQSGKQGRGLLGLTGQRVVQALTKNPPGLDYCGH